MLELNKIYDDITYEMNLYANANKYTFEKVENGYKCIIFVDSIENKIARQDKINELEMKLAYEKSKPALMSKLNTKPNMLAFYQQQIKALEEANN